jgi:hypothetical protein
MLVTLVATFCALTDPRLCEEQRFNVHSAECMVTAQQGISDFMAHDPRYRAGWRLDSWKCFMGNPPPPKVPA